MTDKLAQCLHYEESNVKCVFKLEIKPQDQAMWIETASFKLSTDILQGNSDEANDSSNTGLTSVVVVTSLHRA